MIPGVTEVLQTCDLSPAKAGVIYSPDGEGWRFYPEDRLYIGTTGTNAAPTYVRSLLRFDPARLDPDAFLLQAQLHLYLVGNEPPGVPKLLCLRQPPAGESWTMGAEMAEPPLAEHHLAVETGLVLDSDVTDLMASWRQGAENRGILLQSGLRTLSLVTVGNGRPGEPGPSLRLTYLPPSGRGAGVILEAGPDDSMDSGPLPCHGLVVKNLGPGLAWVTPLYRFERGRPLDPVGVPLGLLRPGTYLVVEPKWQAKAMHIRVSTARQGTRALVIPFAPEAPEGAEGI